MAYYSYQKLYEKLQNETADTNTITLALFKDWLNEGIDKAYSQLNTEYFYGSKTDLTVASQASYPRVFDDAGVVSMKITISSVDYPITEFGGDENQWIALNSDTTTSDIPYWYFVKRNTYELYPTPATASYVITIRYKKAVKALSADDYSTGTIAILADSSTGVHATNTVWTSAMTGRFFKTDDNHWYEITTIIDNTHLTLAREYGGDSISGGTSSYTIGEMSLLPYQYQDGVIYYALERYFALKENQNLAVMYNNKWQSFLNDLKSYGSSMTTSGVLESDVFIINPNDYPTGLA